MMDYGNDTMTFGMAFSRIGMPPAEIRDYLGFPVFTAMELPWEAFSDSDPVQKDAARSGKTVICGSMMDSRLSRGILFAEDKFQKDFSVQLANALQFLASNGIRTATLDCPLENVLASMETQNDLRKILLGAAPVMIREKMTLLLPCSIPAAGASSAMQFMRNTMIPGVKLKLDLMPWHPEYMKTPLPELLGSLLLETENITFRYDADCGNRIMKEQVQAVVSELKKVNFTGTVLLAPMSQGNRMTYPEACRFSGILEELKDFIES